MTDNQMLFHSTDPKRLVLIVEDEEINRNILNEILKDTYTLVFASNGAEAMDAVRRHFDRLSVVLLDLFLPDMNGLDILRWIKDNVHYAGIPVIILTSDRESEVDSLNLGAIDFIPKPYPLPKVIHARVRRTIEFCEDRDIIRSTERDHLTGLYNKEFFYTYSDQYDLYHRDQEMDAVVVDVNHFHIINERYGRKSADTVLCYIGRKLEELVEERGGIACRKEADTFFLYCPHMDDYEELFKDTDFDLGNGRNVRLRLRLGVYSDVDKSIEIERRFDRAKLASDTAKGGFAGTVVYYDRKLQESELFEEQLLESFHTAIKEKQFLVYYQPKFDIRGDEPVLCSAEALVRWKHPELGLINPGIFIPLFENNGLIGELDCFVWSEAAAQLHSWKERFGFAVPISVNVSRVDMMDHDMMDSLQKLISEYGLSFRDLSLEITESAYTEDADRIIEEVKQLRDMGFTVEMDDFGSGYSSLNMISRLPIDALKLDMQFIRNAFSERRDTSMLEIVFEIAEMLGVPTIAEGVETEEQMLTLKVMGCDIVQGYYFSRPLPADEFEPFLIKRIDSGKQEDYIRDFAGHMEHGGGLPGEAHVKAGRHIRDHYIYMAIHDPLTGLFNRSGFDVVYRDTDRNNVAILILRAEMRDRPESPLSDRAIVRTTEILQKYFRSVDRICRWKEDEFVVIMSRINSSMKNRLLSKLARMNEESEADGLILTGGAAFSDPDDTGKDILSAAQEALEESLLSDKGSCIFR